VCGSTALAAIYEAAGLPVFVNVLWPDAAGARNCPRAGIGLALCLDCTFIFNAAFDPDLLEYGEGYENTLHYSPRFQEYADALAAILIERYHLRGKRIVEIGCGGGDFLLMLCERGGNSGTGFDPGCDVRPDGLPAGLDITFIGEPLGARHAPLDAEFIYSRHVLEHVSDPRGFLGMIRSSAGTSGIPCFFEVPNALHTIRNRFIWDIIYEHFAYYTPAALSYLLSAAGFEVREITEEFGGQYLNAHVVTAGTETAVIPPPQADLDELAGEARAFRDACRRMMDEWRARIAGEIEDRRAVVWGGGSKGVTFVNLLDPGGKIPYIVDINPKKHGLYVAGSGQRIIPPSFLADFRPDLVIVMNAIYEKEIRKTVGELGIDPRIICA
jgi:hypothetical protein